ncbi:hypothetical protein PILCRDRAFT_47875, partial [Piloderma croceum F 1598]
RYANTDYALANSLRTTRHLKYILLTYNINCHYEKSLMEHFAVHFPDLQDIIKNLICLIPKLHMRGHKNDCQYEFSLNYTKCCGQMGGELIEGSWSEAKQAGGSTQEMNHGHCHDTLTDQQNDWNWIK